MKNNVLVIAAHPDDEILGAGGTMIKHVSQGDSLHILLLGDGESSRKTMHRIEQRAKQAHTAAQKLGAKNVFLEKLPDNQFDSIPLLQIAQLAEKYILKIKPTIIYTHFAHDLNIDHQLTFQAVLTACRPQPNFFVKKILSFEILSSTEWQYKSKELIFSPSEYVNISPFIEKKLKLMNIYKNELRDFPHPRSLEGIRTLARYRGMEVGLNYAEAFEVVRQIIK